MTDKQDTKPHQSPESAIARCVEMYKTLFNDNLEFILIDYGTMSQNELFDSIHRMFGENYKPAMFAKISGSLEAQESLPTNLLAIFLGAHPKTKSVREIAKSLVLQPGWMAIENHNCLSINTSIIGITLREVLAKQPETQTAHL